VLVSKDAISANSSAIDGIQTLANGPFTLQNTSINLNAGNTVAVSLNGNGGNPEIIENDLISTAGHGIGLVFSGGASVAALVQDTNFQSNLVGVSIVGDGTNAGGIDLGGGQLGSLGGNSFKGFTGTGGNYAIQLILQRTLGFPATAGQRLEANARHAEFSPRCFRMTLASLSSTGLSVL
jgi:hypothetical protein